jgi:hypothetical protein
MLTESTQIVFLLQCNSLVRDIPVGVLRHYPVALQHQPAGSDNQRSMGLAPASKDICPRAACA